jgi:hypothetical protein
MSDPSRLRPSPASRVRLDGCPSWRCSASGRRGTLPIPRRGPRRVRGALAHDIAARHGLSLTEDARRRLRTSRTSRSGALWPPWRSSRGARSGASGALGVVPPGPWLEVYARRTCWRIATSSGCARRRRSASMPPRRNWSEAVDAATLACSHQARALAATRRGQAIRKLRSTRRASWMGSCSRSRAAPITPADLETAFDRVLDEEPVHT